MGIQCVLHTPTHTVQDKIKTTYKGMVWFEPDHYHLIFRTKCEMSAAVTRLEIFRSHPNFRKLAKSCLFQMNDQK
jgi:hypothetical protein